MGICRGIRRSRHLASLYPDVEGLVFINEELQQSFGTAGEADVGAEIEVLLRSPKTRRKSRGTSLWRPRKRQGRNFLVHTTANVVFLQRPKC